MIDVTKYNIVDLLFVSEAKHRPNFTNVHKHIKKCKEEHQMIVAYKEAQLSSMVGRGRRNIVEHVSIFSVKPLVTHHGPRLFYTLTSCATNQMMQADMLTEEQAPQCKKEVKEAIHTSYGIPRHERSLSRDAMVPVMSKEKHICMWREHLHATKAKRAIIATPGGGVLLRACVAQGVKALVISKNEAHMKHLRDHVIEFMVNEAQVNSMCPYHIKRKLVISKLGLDEDDAQASPISGAITITEDLAAAAAQDVPAEAVGQGQGQEPDEGHESDEGRQSDTSQGNGAGSGSPLGSAPASPSSSDSDKSKDSKQPEAVDPMAGLFDAVAPAAKERRSARGRGSGDGDAAAPKAKGKGRGRGRKGNTQDLEGQEPEGAPTAKKRARVKRAQDVD